MPPSSQLPDPALSTAGPYLGSAELQILRLYVNKNALVPLACVHITFLLLILYYALVQVSGKASSTNLGLSTQRKIHCVHWILFLSKCTLHHGPSLLLKARQLLPPIWGGCANRYT